MARMRSTFALLLFGLMLSLGTAAASEGVQALDEAWKKATVAGDIEAVTALYAKDAVVCFPESPEARGTEAIRAAYEGFFAQHTVTAITFDQTHYETSGNLSAGWGNGVLTMTPKAGGDPVSMAIRFTSVARKEGGTWRYLDDHASLHPATPPAAETK